MKKSMQIIKKILFVALISFICSCNKHISEFTIEETTHNYTNDFKVVENYEDALNAEIIDTTKHSKASYEKYYAQNADYLFSMGDGCFTPKIEELYAKQSNDTIKIHWERKFWKPCPPTGKHSPVFAKIIINKQKYPNYKKLVFIPIDDN
ncbi:hypothetical protein [Chryseobacterium gregarium]|uniref:hypothetical protein n=1 Tax=Chryseobacterium gregarium TaxID=456299 RepID=UPI00138ABF6A|nr:hypothetical protein [Chryseobacterium gregarium]